MEMSVTVGTHHKPGKQVGNTAQNEGSQRKEKYTKHQIRLCLHLSIWTSGNTCLLWWVTEHWHRLPIEAVCSPPQRPPKAAWTWPWAACSGCPCWSRRLEQVTSRWSLLTLSILQFCSSNLPNIHMKIQTVLVDQDGSLAYTCTAMKAWKLLSNHFTRWLKKRPRHSNIPPSGIIESYKAHMVQQEQHNSTFSLLKN